MSGYVDSIPRPVRTFTTDERNLLLKITGRHEDSFRDHMVLSLAFGTALRCHEVAALDVGDLFTAEGQPKRRVNLRIFKRGSRRPAPQEVLLPDAVMRKLAKFFIWKRNRGEGTAIDSPLFVARSKRNDKRISNRTLHHLLKMWQERAGFEGKLFGFHATRHYALLDVQRRSKDVRITQRVARHKSLATTQIYVAPSDEEVLQAVKDLNC